MKKNVITLIILLLIPLFAFSQTGSSPVRTVSSLGVEKIDYGMQSGNGIALYLYDGNPFNDNKKTLKFSLRENLYFTISKSDIKPEKLELLNPAIFYGKGTVRYRTVIKECCGGSYRKDFDASSDETYFFELIFDNNPSTYLKIDGDNYKKITTLNHELFLKLKKHNTVIIRKTTNRKYKQSKGWRKDGGEWESIGWEYFNDTIYKDYRLRLNGATAAINKYLGITPPSVKNKNLFEVVNGLANVNPFNLDKYIDKFILDAKINNNIDLSYVNKGDRLIMFRELEGETIAAAYKMNDDNKVLVLVDPENWKNANQAKRWYIIYHELGHDILNLEHGECGPMMNERASGLYTWNRLERDKETMFETYKSRQ